MKTPTSVYTVDFRNYISNQDYHYNDLKVGKNFITSFKIKSPAETDSRFFCRTSFLLTLLHDNFPIIYLPRRFHGNQIKSGDNPSTGKEVTDSLSFSLITISPCEFMTESSDTLSPGKVTVTYSRTGLGATVKSTLYYRQHPSSPYLS